MEIFRQLQTGEEVEEGMHWQRLETSWRPATVIFCCAGGTNTIGVVGDMLGSYRARYLTVLRTVAQIPVEDVVDPVGRRDGDGFASDSTVSTAGSSDC